MTEKTTIEDIAIPDNVFVPCPKGGKFDNVRVNTSCPGCDQFRGLVGLSQTGAQAKFTRRFRVNCGHPVPREMLEVKL